MNVLVLTNVLPAPILTFNARENDVLIRTAALHESQYPDVHYTFVFVLHTAFTAQFQSKYREHKDFINLKSYTHAGRNIEIITVPTFKWNEKLWPLYVRLAYWRNKRKIQKIVRDNKIDLIHAHNFFADIGMAYEINKDLKIPFLVTIRKIGLLESLGKHIRKYAAQASAMISLGIYELNLCESLNKNIQLISHGIDDRFLTQEKQFSSSKTLKIVTVARLLHWKYIDQVLFALEQIDGDFTYDIYGDGPHEATLKGIVAKSSIANKVTFHGFIDYSIMPQTLAQYDLFVMPSYRELFGRVYIEAMACGLPVICAKTTGMDGYITIGEQGFVVDHTSVEEIRETICKFIDNPELKVVMGKKAQAFAKDFSWDTVVEKIDGLYRSLVNEPVVNDKLQPFLNDKDHQAISPKASTNPQTSLSEQSEKSI
jgi:teichuronic acid biosynthesis glycosyltransferase TuaC